MENTNTNQFKEYLKDAKKRDLIEYLQLYHTNKIFYGGHEPDLPYMKAWRSTEHDSLTFYTVTASDGTKIHRYKRWSTGECGDAIDFLTKYLGYENIAIAAEALAFDPVEENIDVDSLYFQEMQ